MEFAIVVIHFLAVNTPLFILIGIALLGMMQPEEMRFERRGKVPASVEAVRGVLADDEKLRYWFGQADSNLVFELVRTTESATLSRQNANESLRETWNVTVRAADGGAEIVVAQTVYSRSSLYRGAMKLFFKPMKETDRFLATMTRRFAAAATAAA